MSTDSKLATRTVASCDDNSMPIAVIFSCERHVSIANGMHHYCCCPKMSRMLSEALAAVFID